jgi:hypothetical protein
MKTAHENLSKLKSILASTYLGREKAEVSDVWQVRTMNQIRSMGPLSSKANYFDVLGQYMWRLAPVACGLILVLATAISQLDFTSDFETVRIFTEDPADFSLLALL